MKIKKSVAILTALLTTIGLQAWGEVGTAYMQNAAGTVFVDAEGNAVTLDAADIVVIDSSHYTGGEWNPTFAALGGHTVLWQLPEGNIKGMGKNMRIEIASGCTAFVRCDVAEGCEIAGAGTYNGAFGGASGYALNDGAIISCTNFNSTTTSSAITINGNVTISSANFTLNGTVKLSTGASLTVNEALAEDKVALASTGARLKVTTGENTTTYSAQPIAYDENHIEPYHWYTFDGDNTSSGQAEMIPASGLGNTGYGFTDGAVAGGQAADNINLWADTGLSLGSGDWTIVFVGKLAQTANGILYAVGSTSHGNQKKGIIFASRGETNPGIIVKSFGGNYSFELAADIPNGVGAFHQYALTYANKTYTLFVDGVKQAEQACEFVTIDGYYQFGDTHGGTATGMSAAADNDIDDFRVYHQALTEKQLAFAAATFGLVDMKTLVPNTFEIANDGNFKLNGTNFLIRCAEMHFARMPRPYWRQRIQMAKAGGFNAVCAYMFWNNHEPEKGYFRFTGDQDIGEFCRIAKEEGMWVVLRPGPYVCAEWEYGGFPWWFRKEGVAVRTQDEKYMHYSKLYLDRVFQEVAEHQITRGGNILMVQVENEYGFFGSSTDYMRACYNCTKDAGFSVPLFTCAPKNYLTYGYIPELFPVINGGSGFTGEGGGFEALQNLRKGTPWEGGPLMVGEYYPAWYDSWGNAHQTKATQDCVNDLTAFCENNASFSMYMTHGGTSFGWWGGFNESTQAMTPSYDFNAPISEAGHYTEKFWAFKEVLDAHLNAFETAVPSNAAPAEIEVQTATITADAQYACFWDMPDEQFSFITNDTNALTFELSDLGYGYLLYETTIPAGLGGTMTATVKDVGVVRIDGEEVGYFDYRYKSNGIYVAAAEKDRKLQIFVEAFGRSHFYLTRDVDNGIQSEVKIGDTKLTDWTMKTFNLIEHKTAMNTVVYTPDTEKTPRSASLYKYTVNLEYGKDAFLDMHDWKRGMVCLNGRWLGRYWSIGPQQTLYVPGCWLNESGENELIILDLIGAEPPTQIKFVADHVINELRASTDYYVAPPLRPDVPDGYLTTPVKTGDLANVRTVQTNTFDSVQTGRYVGITITSAYANHYAACAEFGLLDDEGNEIDRKDWSIIAISSEEYVGEQAQAEKMIDGDSTTFWHSEWKINQTQLPQSFVIDLGSTQTISGFTWQSRATSDIIPKGYSAYVLTYGPDEEPPEEEKFIVDGGTRAEPIDISEKQNIAITILSNSVAKITASGNVTFTITGSGETSELILAGTKDWGFNKGSVLTNLTIVVDDADHIFWFDSRTPPIFDASVDVVITNKSPVKVGGGIVTIGSLSGDGAITVNGQGALVVTDPLGGSGFTGTLPSNTTIKLGDLDVTSGCTNGQLDPTKSVTVGEESVPVKPTLDTITADETVGTVPFVVGDESVSVGVKTIPGVTYELIRSKILGGFGEAARSVAEEKATGTRTKLVDETEDRPKDKAFYIIRLKK